MLSQPSLSLFALQSAKPSLHVLLHFAAPQEGDVTFVGEHESPHPPHAVAEDWMSMHEDAQHALVGPHASPQPPQ